MNEIRFNQPQKIHPMLVKETVIEDNGKETNQPKVGKIILRFLGLLLILAIIIGGVFGGRDIFVRIFENKSEPYSAVFLANGQVYFGKMVGNNKEEIILNNVYYIQIANTTQEKTTNALNQTSFNLVKLGNELHGPTDELFINRSQVVFYEYLRDDSKVVESIKNYK